MKKVVKEPRVAKTSAWLLSSIAFVVSIISAFVLEDVTLPGNSTLGIIGSLFYVVLIPLACFVICMKYPKSVWYTPLICNPVGLLGTIFHPLAWTTLSEYLLWVISLVLSISGAVIGAKIGSRKINQEV